MNALGVLHATEAVALGWTLLHFLWQSTAIALLFALADRCAVRASASVRYGMAMAALALMPIAAVITFFDQERLVVPAIQNQQPVLGSQLGALHVALVEQLPIAAPAVGNGELWIAEHACSFLPWMDGLWLAGVLLLALRAAAGWWQLQTVRRRAQAAVPRTVTATFDKLVRQYRLSRRVILRVSDEVISPMIFGVWRTVLLLPISAALSLPQEQLEAVLVHELAHIRRWDYLCNLLQTAVECLFFFHPAMWWVSHRVRDLREVCCDEAAARACADPVIYAEALLQLEEQRGQHLHLAIALHGSGGTLLNRVRRILGENAMEQKSMSGMRMIAAGLVVAGLYIAPHVAHGLKGDGRPVSTSATIPMVPLEQIDADIDFDAETLASNAHSLPNPEPAATPEPAAAPAAASAPTPEPAPISSAPAPHPMPMAVPMPMALSLSMGAQAEAQQGGGMQYIENMRAAGYPLDLNKDLNQIVALRSVGVTPEYAKSMAQAGLGTPTLHELVSLKSLGITPDYAKSVAQLGIGSPTLHDLISLKSVGVTPEYLASLKASSASPATLHDAVAFKSLGVTPDYVKSLEGLGLGKPSVHDVTSMKSVGVTPEYLAGLKASGIGPNTLHDAVSMKAVGVTPEYASAMAAAGLSNLSAHDLVSLKAQGVTPDCVKWLKANFPDADLHAMRQATAFHIDADFVANAKSHGFNVTSLDKLTKLKMSGLLN